MTAVPVQPLAGRAAWTQLVELVDWSALPEATQPIASMLADGWLQTEIAHELALREEDVAMQVRALRDAIVEQALDRANELSAELRERLNLEFGVGRAKR